MTGPAVVVQPPAPPGIVRFYAQLLPGFFLVVWTMALRGVISHANRLQATLGSESSPSSALFEFGKPLYLLPAILVVRFVISMGPVSRAVLKLGFPLDDADLVSGQNTWFRLLPVMLYLCAWMCSCLHGFLALHLMSALSYGGKLLALLPGSASRLVLVMRWTLCVVAIASCFLCGALGICLSNFLLIINVVHILYQFWCNLDTAETRRQLALFFCLMMSLTWTSLVCLPALVVWCKQVALSGQPTPLSSDSSRLPALAICVCVTVLINTDCVRPSRTQRQVSGWVLSLVAVLSALYAMDSLYRIPWFTCLVFVTATAPSITALVYRRDGKEEEEEDE